MSIPLLGAGIKVLSGLVGLAGEYIEDKDKLNEFNHRARELESNLVETIVETKTTPRVDALVKLLYALNSLFRPIMGAAMTAFAAYCHFKGVPLDPALELIFAGAFPAWGVSRHIQNKKK